MKMDGMVGGGQIGLLRDDDGGGDFLTSGLVHILGTTSRLTQCYHSGSPF